MEEGWLGGGWVDVWGDDGWMEACMDRDGEDK